MQNLVSMLDGYFAQGAHHVNINVLNRETLMDAYDHPEEYPTLTIRVSGYAVNFVRLSGSSSWKSSTELSIRRFRKEPRAIAWGFKKGKNMQKLLGNIHSFESMGAVDGPGLRFVVFMQGCPMRCAYCHNPDTWDFAGGGAIFARAGRGEGDALCALLEGGRRSDDFRRRTHDAERVLRRSIPATAGEGRAYGAGYLLRGRECRRGRCPYLYEPRHGGCKVFIRGGVPEILRGQLCAGGGVLRLTERMGVPLWVRHVVVPGLTDGQSHIAALGAYAKKFSNLKKLNCCPSASSAFPSMSRWESLPARKYAGGGGGAGGEAEGVIMKDFIILNGTMGAGKSTVCAELKELLPKCGFIEGDACWTWRADLGEAAKEMVLRNIAFLADAYLACPDYESVLLCWVIPEEKIFAEILGRMQQRCWVHRFTLLLEKEALMARLERDIAQGRRQRCRPAQLGALSGLCPHEYAKIEVSDISPRVAAEEILSAVHAKNKENG